MTEENNEAAETKRIRWMMDMMDTDKIYYTFGIAAATGLSFGDLAPKTLARDLTKSFNDTYALRKDEGDTVGEYPTMHLCRNGVVHRP